ncbi:MAG: hypothetical protein LBB84_01540 [Tannerellaceae bacterium]|jgi:hypothetical protein|nr:hypothetical protein [Tannerellaceae bacterium]
MQSIQLIKQKSDIISWVTGLEDKETIRQLHRMATAHPQKDPVKLSPAKVELLKTAEQNIKDGRIFTEEELEELDKHLFE